MEIINIKKLIWLFLFCVLFGCGTGIPSDFIKPAVNEKIALTIKNYQSTKCLKHCLVDKVDECYCDIDEFPKGNCEEQEKKCVKVCPDLKYKAFKCTDLYANESGGRAVYWIEPWEWQNYFEHLTVITFLEQDIAQLTQIDFLCKHDFILCENHLDVIEALKEFAVDLNENQ